MSKLKQSKQPIQYGPHDFVEVKDVGRGYLTAYSRTRYPNHIEERYTVRFTEAWVNEMRATAGQSIECTREAITMVKPAESIRFDVRRQMTAQQAAEADARLAIRGMTLPLGESLRRRFIVEFIGILVAIGIVCGFIGFQGGRIACHKATAQEIIK